MEENECAKKLKFLLSASFVSLPESNVKLRSILNIHTASIAEIFNLKLPKYFSNSNMSCPYCFTPCNQNFNSFKLLPSAGKKFKKQIRSKNLQVGDAALDGTTKEVFCTRNTLILKCQVCTKKSKFILEKSYNYKEEYRKQIANVTLKKAKKNKKKVKNMLLKGKVIFEADSNKRLLNPSGSGVVVSKPILDNKNSKKKKNCRFTTLGLKESNQQTEPVLHLNSTKRLSTNLSNKDNRAVAKKKQLNRLRKAMRNQPNIHKNSLKDLLTIIRK